MRTSSSFNQQTGNGFSRPAKAPTCSWWLQADTFYDEARKRFPADSPTKDHMPVNTYGSSTPSFSARASEYRRDQQRKAVR